MMRCGEREAFFLPLGDGQRFCLYTPALNGREKAAVVYIHPLAEELNKTRQMVAVQVAALARAGCAVLQIDLLGCGDSSGDFGDASWLVWRDDVVEACRWLRSRSAAPLWLWGLRAGALLAVEAAGQLPEASNLLFWQPVQAGRQAMQQLLRLAALAGGVGDGGLGAAIGGLQDELAKGGAIEVAGYRLGPALSGGLEAARLLPPLGRSGRVVWFDVSNREMPEILPSTAALLAQWQSAGFETAYRILSGPAFWQTAEIECAPALIDATAAIFQAAP